MKHNVGSFDAAFRVLLGLGIMLVAHHERSWWGLLAIVPLATGLLAYCPLYTLVKFDTSYQDEYDDRHTPPSSTTKV